MGGKVDKEGLTQKQRLFVNEYCRSGNAYQAYIKIYEIEEDSRRTTIDQRVRQTLRKESVQNYIKERNLAIEKSSKADALFVINSLLKVVEDNEGKSCSIKAIELVGKLQGMFWEIPGRKLEENISVDNNIEAIKKIVAMAQCGQISEGCATNWIQMLEQKSKVEEREGVNKEIIERLDKFDDMMKEKSAEI